MGAIPIESCSVRIQRALNIRGLRQTDLSKKTGISKGAISEYIKGAYEPKQDNIMLIANALSVDPVWLMGYDVPMEKVSSPDKLKLTEGEKALLDLFTQVPVDQQQLVLQMIRAALGSQE